MAQSAYWKLLQHPNWQRKRLEILERDNFACTYCGADTEQLHVHHGYYRRGANPWDYPNKSLTTLCEPCHKSAQNEMQDVHEAIGLLDAHDIQRVLGYALGLLNFDRPNKQIALTSYEAASGVADAWRLSVNDVIAASSDGQISIDGLNKYAKDLTHG